MITDPDKVWEVLITNDAKQYARYDWFYRFTKFSNEPAYKIKKVNWCYWRPYQKCWEACVSVDMKNSDGYCPPWFVLNKENGMSNRYCIIMQEREKYSMINTVLLDTLVSFYKTSSGYFDCEVWSGKYDEFYKLDALKIYGLNETQFKYLFHPDSYPNPNKISHLEFVERIREMIKQAEKENA